jgi:quercetin dioxygenase-like cupin family protein
MTNRKDPRGVSESTPIEAIPPDDPHRQLARSNADQPVPHLGIVGDTYTILLSGEDTAGRYCLIDMYVPPGGGPPPHRHDYEESFTVLEGEIEATFRGVRSVVRAGETINIPANAPHTFRNTGAQPARLLCVCAPAGLDAFFKEIGVPVESRTAPPPALGAADQAAFRAKIELLSPRYRTELLPEA